jgi:hypothetical protein
MKVSKLPKQVCAEESKRYDMNVWKGPVSSQR